MAGGDRSMAECGAKASAAGASLGGAEGALMTRHTDQNSAILDQFTKQAESYAKLTQNSRDLSLAPLLEATRPSSADNVLDVACGAGSLTLALAAVAGHATGIDI